MRRPVIVVGAGGHASVVADALLACGIEVLGFTDADARNHNSNLCGLPVLGDDEHVLSRHEQDKVLLANGVGGVRCTELRRMVQTRLENLGWNFTSLRHPSAIVSPRAHIGESVQLLAGSVVQVGAEIGKGSIVNTAAVIEHDCSIGDYVHVAPRSLVCGDVKVGAHGHIGAGAVIKQGVRLGVSTTVGAGAVVIRDFVGNGTLVGVPARAMEPKP